MKHVPTRCPLKEIGDQFHSSLDSAKQAIAARAKQSADMAALVAVVYGQPAMQLGRLLAAESTATGLRLQQGFILRARDPEVGYQRILACVCQPLGLVGLIVSPRLGAVAFFVLVVVRPTRRTMLV